MPLLLALIMLHLCLFSGMRLIKTDRCDLVPTSIHHQSPPSIGEDISPSLESRPHCFPNPVTGYTKNLPSEAMAADRLRC